MIFIYLEKALIKYQEILCGRRLKRNESKKNTTFIKNMYANIVICVGTCDGESDIFSIKIGLHKGSALNSYIFTLVMDNITKDIQGDNP
jgi:hypothetical protein